MNVKRCLQKFWSPELQKDGQMGRQHETELELRARAKQTGIHSQHMAKAEVERSIA